MKNYKKLSKVTLILCLCGIILDVFNACTGIINPSIQLSGTMISIVGFCVAGIVTLILENERAKKAVG